MSDAPRGRRSGGRAARQALRAETSTEVRSFLTRTMAPFEVLSVEGLEIIEHNADTILAEMGIETVERDVDRSEIMMADEAFFCGTAWEVAPILGIDKVAIGSGSKGPITSRLQKLYFDICDGSSGQHTEWRMPVYAGSNAKAAE